MCTLLCKAKRQYLLTCKVSRYCPLAFHGRCTSSNKVFHVVLMYLYIINQRRHRASTWRRLNACLMLGQRRRRWPSIKPALSDAFLAGKMLNFTFCTYNLSTLYYISLIFTLLLFLTSHVLGSLLNVKVWSGFFGNILEKR